MHQQASHWPAVSLSTHFTFKTLLQWSTASGDKEIGYYAKPLSLGGIQTTIFIQLINNLKKQVSPRVDQWADVSVRYLLWALAPQDVTSEISWLVQRAADTEGGRKKKRKNKNMFKTKRRQKGVRMEWDNRKKKERGHYLKHKKLMKSKNVFFFNNYPELIFFFLL